MRAKQAVTEAVQDDPRKGPFVAELPRKGPKTKPGEAQTYVVRVQYAGMPPYDARVSDRSSFDIQTKVNDLDTCIVALRWAPRADKEFQFCVTRWATPPGGPNEDFDYVELESRDFGELQAAVDYANSLLKKPLPHEVLQRQNLVRNMSTEE